MSQAKHVMEITPPSYGIREERETLRGYRCPVCNGEGGFTCETGRDEYETKPCDYCDGTGRVKATVVVSWWPDYDS